jgi:hypothetical protein
MQNTIHPPVTGGLSASSARSKAPVFVLGAPRSGTTYVYHALLSAGNFAIYRAESEVLHLLEPRFGDLSVARNKRRLLAAWFTSRLFTASGLERNPLQERIMQECKSGGDFLRIVMEEVARHQGVERWAECTPDHILYLLRIQQTIPDALVIHIIRDGRDVALSMERQGYPQKFPWDRNRRRMAAGLYWEWIVRKGRHDGKQLGANYIEVHYEDLMAEPEAVLERLGTFIHQKLDYDQIRRVGIGSVGQPNTSFREESEDGAFNPVGRWRKLYSPEEAVKFEELAGQGLREFGYPLEATAGPGKLGVRALRAQYRAFFDAKFFIRTQTPLGRVLVTRDLSRV